MVLVDPNNLISDRFSRSGRYIARGRDGHQRHARDACGVQRFYSHDHRFRHFHCHESCGKANAVFAGPTSGLAAAPTFRPMVTSDLPSGAGTVTNVTLAVSAGALFTASISGTNPITSTGTATLNITFANQAANTIIAGPASGATGPVSARQAVAADIAGIKAVTFSATPVFDASLFALPTFTMTLTATSLRVASRIPLRDSTSLLFSRRMARGAGLSLGHLISREHPTSAPTQVA